MPGRAVVRRRALLALPVAGCAQDGTTPYAFGIGDPVRGAALYAPRDLGNTSRYAGDPAGAAAAAAQLELLADALATDPIWAPRINPAVLQQLQAARAEMRQRLGITSAARPAELIAALRGAAIALRAGRAAQAEAALATPDFTAGPGGTLQRLGSLPRLPRTAEAAGGVAAEFDRLDRSR